MRIALVAGTASLVCLLTACDVSQAVPVQAAEAPAPAATAEAAPPPAEYPAAVGLADDKPGLEVVEEVLEGGFMRAGYHPSSHSNSNPTWGSHGLQGDADTGIAKVTFDIPAGAKRIGIPVAIGPTHDLLTLQVLDAKGAPFATLAPAAEEYLQWKLWEVALVVPEQTKLSVEGSDTGAEWGQWIAFGQPRVIE